jgi:hypothetical protein
MMNAARAPSQDAPRRLGATQEPRPSEDFERVLRDKACAHDEDRDAACAAPLIAMPDDASCGVATSLPVGPAPLAAAALPSSHGSEPCAGAQLSVASAALGTALAADPGPLPAAALQTGTQEGAWDVSLHEPMGVAIELRATRPATSILAGAAPGWTLTIASPALDAAVLAHHAPRLNERLRKRALTHTHVRIEGGGDGS